MNLEARKETICLPLEDEEGKEKSHIRIVDTDGNFTIVQVDNNNKGKRNDGKIYLPKRVNRDILTAKRYSTVPTNIEGTVCVPIDELRYVLTQVRNPVVYILWPEEKEILSLVENGIVYGLGNPSNMEEYKDAIRSGVEEVLDRELHIVEKEDRQQWPNHHIPIEEKKSDSTSNSIVLPRRKKEQSLPEVTNGNVEEKRLFQPVQKKTANIQLPRKKGKSGKVLVVTSSKGGIGKSTISLNLGYSLNRTNERVVIVDAMYPHGNIATRFLIETDININSWKPYFERGSVTEKEILSNLVVTSENGTCLYIVPGINKGEDYSPELLEFVLSNLKKVFGYIVVDMGVEKEEALKVAIEHSEQTFLIVDYDKATIKDTQDYVSSWYEEDDSVLEKLKVLVNFEPVKKDKNPIARKQCEEYLQALDFIGFLPEVGGMRTIHNEGKLISQIEKRNRFKTEMEKFISQAVPEFPSTKKKRTLPFMRKGV